MNYVIIEQQTTDGTTAVLPPVIENNINQALFSFLNKSAYASISSVPLHTVTILSEDGKLVRPSEVFRHEPEVEEEPVVEGE